MLNGMLNILQAYWVFISIVFTATVAFLVYRANANEISYRLMNWWYSVPWIGRTARLSGDLTRSTKPGWLRAEQTLCADYRKHIRPVSRAMFDNYLTYLRKAHDLGRRPLPLWMWLFLGVLLIAEGLGFSYLLGTQMALEGSENTRTLLMLAIVLVISGILLWITHAAGHQLYRTGLLRSCLKQFKLYDHDSLSTRTIGLSEDQSKDDREPEVSQCVNRVKARPFDAGSYVWVYIAAAAIIIIAAGSTWLRFSHFEASRVASTVSSGPDPFADSGSELPDAVTAPQQAADSKAAADTDSASKSEATAAFVMLGFIFAITQIVGIGAGYRYGFGGKEGYTAWRETRGHSDFESYYSPYERRIDTAEARLQQLQQLLTRDEGRRLDLNKSFRGYVEENGEAGPDAFAIDHRPKQAAAAEAKPDPVADALGKIEAAGKHEDKLAILLALTQEDRDAVQTQLAERKLRPSRAQVESQFEGLL